MHAVACPPAYRTRQCETPSGDEYIKQLGGHVPRLGVDFCQTDTDEVAKHVLQPGREAPRRKAGGVGGWVVRGPVQAHHS